MFPYPINDLIQELIESGAIEISNGALSMKKLLKVIEKKMVIGVLRILNGNKSKSSKRLGITRMTLDHKLRQYGREEEYRKILNKIKEDYNE